MTDDDCPTAPRVCPTRLCEAAATCAAAPATAARACRAARPVDRRGRYCASAGCSSRRRRPHRDRLRRVGRGHRPGPAAPPQRGRDGAGRPARRRRRGRGRLRRRVAVRPDVASRRRGRPRRWRAARADRRSADDRGGPAAATRRWPRLAAPAAPRRAGLHARPASSTARRAAITVGWVGDSRAYWLPPDGAGRQLTEDDSWAAEMVAAGVLTRAPPMRDPQRARHHPLARRGRAHRSRACARSRPTAPGVLLLCSDGLWNYLPEPPDAGRAAAPVATRTGRSPRPPALTADRPRRGRPRQHHRRLHPRPTSQL